MTLIGIAGGSASGKTSLAVAIAEYLGDQCLRIAHDRYYRDLLTGSSTDLPNFDHPDALDNMALREDLQALKLGRTIRLRDYDMTTHRPTPEATWTRCGPAHVVVLDGIHVLGISAIRALLDLTVYVDAPADIRLARRIRRDTLTRGRAAGDVLDQYLATVRPMHRAHVEPTKSSADLVVDGTRSITEIRDAVLLRLTTLRSSEDP
ncbi:MAG: uridine kinase [Myxococcales bacterium]|nr:uridine kinase [Myxococcales bacterium]